MQERKKLIIQILILLAVLGLIFVAVKYYKTKYPSQPVSQEEMAPPPLLDTKQFFEILKMDGDNYKVRNLVSKEETAILIPPGVKPNFIGGIKEVKTGYFLELYKYRIISGGIIAHLFNVVATSPLTVKEMPANMSIKITGGLVSKIEKSQFTVTSSSPGGVDSSSRVVAFDSKTIFVIVDHINNKTVEKKSTSANLKDGQSVTVLYTQEKSPGVALATKVEILGLAQLPIGQPPK